MKSKLVFLLAAFVATAAGLFSQSPQKESKSDAESALQKQIVSKEREELDSLKSGRMDVFAALLGDDAVFVDSRGADGKAAVVEHTAGFKLQEYSMEDIRFVPLSETSGLISYKFTEKGVSHGREFAGQVYVSALWVEREGKWVCVFSQETPAR